MAESAARMVLPVKRSDDDVATGTDVLGDSVADFVSVLVCAVFVQQDRVVLEQRTQARRLYDHELGREVDFRDCARQSTDDAAIIVHVAAAEHQYVELAVLTGELEVAHDPTQHRGRLDVA
jgi:hypothetical protein